MLKELGRSVSLRSHPRKRRSDAWCFRVTVPVSLSLMVGNYASMIFRDALADAVSQSSRKWLPRNPLVGRSVAEFGTGAFVDNSERSGVYSWDYAAPAMREWVSSFKDRKNGLATFTDTSLLYTCSRIVDHQIPPSPFALFDLGTLVRLVVLYDHVVHFENSSIDSAAWNERLGARVFLPVSRGIARSGGELFVEPAGYGLYHIISDVLKRLERMRRNPDPLDRDYLSGAREIWEKLIGVKIGDEQLLGNCLEDTVYWGGSPTCDVFLDWTLVSSIKDEDWEKIIKYGRSGQVIGSTVSDANCRSLINAHTAAVLEIPYSGSVFRASFRSMDLERSKLAEEQLRSIEMISKSVRARANGSLVSIELPVFLAALLGRIESLEEFWPFLAELRDQARGFRARRRELEYSLADDGSKYQSRVQKQLLDAVCRESRGLVSMLRVPVAGAAAATVASALSGPVVAALTSIAMLSAWEKIDSEAYDLLVSRFRRPYEYFLSSVGEDAAAMLQGLPRVSRLWGVKEADLATHVSFLKRVQGLRL